MATFESVENVFNIEKGSLQSSKCEPGEYTFITASSEWKTHRTYSHDCEAIIIAVAASGSLGRTHYFKGKFVASDLCLLLTPKNESEVNLKFYYYYFNFIRRKLVRATATGTSKLAINTRNLGKFKIILPDIDIQNAYLKTMEVISRNHSELSNKFEDAQYWIGRLRQSILEDATSGKLVPQDPKDEPASELLKKIKAEEERLIKEGKIRKEKPLDMISEREISDKIPNSWIICRLSDVTEHIVDCPHSTPEFVDEGKFCIDTNSIDQGRIIFDKLRKVSDKTFDERTRRLKPSEGDIVFSREGTIGLAVILPRGLEVCLGQRVMLFRTFKEILPEYFRLVITSDLVRNTLSSKLMGTAAKHVNVKDIKKVTFRLPPTGEQKRIVEKVKELMKNCDELEDAVKRNQENSDLLMEAVLKEAFAS
jgi:type I restriction enzyme S subunit